jgi:hypothetical protein
MTVTATRPCACCGGRGWKFLTYRRSRRAVSGAPERAAQRLARVICVFCAGTGQIPAE